MLLVTFDKVTHSTDYPTIQIHFIQVKNDTCVYIYINYFKFKKLFHDNIQGCPTHKDYRTTRSIYYYYNVSKIC